MSHWVICCRDASTTPEELVVSEADDSLASNSTLLLPGVRTFVVVHGFNDKTEAAWVQDMKDALLEKVSSSAAAAAV